MPSEPSDRLPPVDDDGTKAVKTEQTRPVAEAHDIHEYMVTGLMPTGSTPGECA